MCALGERLTSPFLLLAVQVQQGKRPGNPVGGKAQPNSKGKFTRAGSVLGRSTEDVNDHYHFHEVRARTGDNAPRFPRPVCC